MNVGILLEAVKALLSSEAEAVNQANVVLTGMCSSPEVVNVCMEALAIETIDDKATFIILTVLQTALSRIPELNSEIVRVLQVQLVTLLCGSGHEFIRPVLSSIIGTTVSRGKCISDELKSYITSGPITREYFEIFMRFLLLAGVSPEYVSVIRDRIAQGIQQGQTIQEKLFALYFLVHVSQTLLRDQSLMEEFKDVFPQLFQEAVSCKSKDPLEVFGKLIQRYDSLMLPYLPFELQLASLGRTDIPEPNLLVLQEIVNDIIRKIPKGTYTKQQIQAILVQLVKLSIHILSQEHQASEPISIDSLFMQILSHADVSDGIEMVTEAVTEVGKGNTIACAGTALALIDDAISCYGYFDFAGTVLSKAMTTDDLALKKWALEIICDGRDLLREYILENVEQIIIILCRWILVPFKSQRGPSRGEFCVDPLRFLGQLIPFARHIPADPDVSDVITHLARFMQSDIASEVSYSAHILSVLVKNRIVDPKTSEDLIRSLIIMKVRGSVLVEREAIAVLLNMFVSEPDFMRKFLPELLTLQNIACINFCIRLLAIYQRDPEISGRLMTLVAEHIGPILTTIEGTINGSDDLTDVATTCQTVALIMLAFPDQGERTWTLFISCLRKLLPPEYMNANGITVASHSLNLIYAAKLIEKMEEPIVSLEDVLWKCVSASAKDINMLTELNKVLKKHVQLVGMSRSVATAVDTDLNYCRVIMGNSKCSIAETSSFLLSCKSFFKSVLKTTGSPTLAHDLVTMADQYLISAGDHLCTVGMLLQFCYLVEMFGSPIQSGQLLEAAVNLMNSSEPEVAVSAAEFIFSISDKDPKTFSEMRACVEPTCVQGLQKPDIDDELANYLVAILVGLPDSPSIGAVFGHLTALSYPVTYQRIFAWIAHQLSQTTDPSRILTLSEPIIVLFTLNLGRAVQRRYIAPDVVSALAQFLSKIPPDNLAQIISRVAKDPHAAQIVQKNVTRFSQS